MAEEDLPATTPRFQYQGIRQCLRSFQLEEERHDKAGNPGGYVIVYNVDGRSFLECFVNSEESVLTHAWKTYNFTSYTVILKMSSKIHEVAITAFSFLVDGWSRQAETLLLTTLKAQIQGLSRNKRPDCSWKPAVEVGGQDRHWPTVILEVGWTEIRSKLEQDMLFWLQESGAVNVALTMKVEGITVDGKGVKREANITIQQWVLRETRRGPSLKPVQTMKIVRDPAGDHRISGSLTIRFEDAFARRKRGNETDFRLSHEDMKDIARRVWNRQFETQSSSAAGPSVPPSKY